MARVQFRNPSNNARCSFDVKIPKEVQAKGKEAAIKYVNEHPELQAPLPALEAYDVTLDNETVDIEAIREICKDDPWDMLWYIASHFGRPTAMGNAYACGVSYKNAYEELYGETF